MADDRKRFQVTVRYGAPRYIYHRFEVDAVDIRDALARAGDQLPDEISETGDLVEIRPHVDPDAREYLEG